MQYWIVVLALCVTTWTHAQEPEAAVESTEQPVQPDAEQNIFQSLQIELLDLDQLREELASKLTGESVTITLDQVVQMALQNNQDILIIGYETGIADASLMSARGEFDPALNLGARHSDSTSPPNPQTVAFAGISTNIETEMQDYQLTLSGFSPIGTTYDIGFNVNREIGTFTTPRDAMGNPLDPEAVWSGDLVLNVTQPILRGFGTKANLVRVRSAKNQQKIALEQVQLQLLFSIGDVVKAYWDLVGAIEQVTVQQQALENANRVLRINEQRYELGTAAALEVLSAKAGVAVRQSDLISARTNQLAAEDLLKTLIGMYDESGELISMASLVPVERPNIQDIEWDMESSMRTAIERRPDIKIADLQVDNAELEVQRARNDLMPQLDLQGSYGRSTVRLEGNEIFEGIGEPDGDSWSIGAILSIPLGNRTARGNFTQAKLITRQQEQRLIKAKQDVMLSVRLAIQALASNRILVESTKQSRVLEEANVAAEERRLRIGVTTAQNVLDRQEDLTAAQASEVRAQVDFEKSIVDLQVAEGTLLENMGIVYDVPEYDETLGFFESLGPID